MRISYWSSDVCSSDLFAGGQAPSPWWQRAVFALLVLCLSALGARSTLGHRPLNPAMAAFCANPVVNQLPLNSSYSLANAARRWVKREDTALDLSGALPDEEVNAAVRTARGLPDIAFTDTRIPPPPPRSPSDTRDT